MDLNESAHKELMGIRLLELELVMRGIPTLDAISVYFNLMARKFRLCCISDHKEDIIKMADDIHEGLIKEINEAYVHRG